MSQRFNEMSLLDFLRTRATEGRVSFHMPGHKGGAFFRRLGYEDYIRNLVDLDITEIPGADNLFQPEGVIKQVMERYKALYDAGASLLSVGGSSNGLMAAIMSLCNPGDEILIARNCHKSVYNGIALAGAKATYIYPEIVEGYGFSGEITPIAVKQAIDSMESGKPKVVVITSPNYYGILSDIDGIAGVCHEHNIPLIVDQAHGAHLKFTKGDGSSLQKFAKGDGSLLQKETSNTSWAAEDLGADVVVNSIHKTLAAFTQTAVVNVMSDLVNADDIADKLEMLESSSPSYILMSSLDLNAEILEREGTGLMKEWMDNLDKFYEEAKEIEGLVVYEAPCHDRTKILLDMTERGIPGTKLEEMLAHRGVDLELSDNRIAMAMTGIGNRWEDYEKLLEALRDISLHEESSSKESGPSKNLKKLDIFTKPSVEFSLDKSTVLSNCSGEEGKVFYKEAVGEIAGKPIIPYPPGIPLVVPGEVLTEDILEEAVSMRMSGHKVLGIDIDGRVWIKLK